MVFSWKWVLEVLKKNTIMQPKWQQKSSKVAIEAGLKKLRFMLKGPGNGRESAIRSLHNGGIEAPDYRCYPMPHTMDVVLKKT
jgi:small subunit ribosomal protein S11